MREASPSPGAREVLLRALLVLASVAAVALGLEAALRLGGYSPSTFGRLRHVSNGARTLALDCYPDNPRGRFDLDLRDPEVRRRYRERGIVRVDQVAAAAPHALEFRYNALGLRGAEVAPRRPHTVRVAVLGDSFTEGWGVHEDEAYPARLEALLDAQAPGAFEVLNGGRRAFDLPELLDPFERLLSLDPDLVVYGLVLNDAVRSPPLEERRRLLDDFIMVNWRTRDEGPAWRFTDSRLFALLHDRVRTFRLSRETTRFYLDLWSEANREGVARTHQILRDMDAALRRRGGRLLVAQWPLLVGLEGGYPFAAIHERVADFCAEAGIAYRDLVPVLRGQRSESLWVHAFDHHPNEQAHEIVARALEGPVRALAPSP